MRENTELFLCAEDDPSLATSIFGYLMFSRGVGNILSTPISTVLSAQRNTNSSYTIEEGSGFDVGGGRFEKMILYVGSCFAGAATVILIGWAMESKKSGSRRA